MRSLPLLVLFCLAACLAPWSWPGAAHAEIVDRIVAEVNNEIITMSELDQMANMVEPRAGLNPKEAQTLKREMLESLIDRKLAQAEAKKRGLTISDKDLDQAVNEFKQRNRIPDDAALNQALAQRGMTLKDLRQQISDQMVQERLVTLAVGSKKIEVPEAEVRRFYDANVREGGKGIMVHLQVINMPFPPGATVAQKEEVQKKAESVLKDYRLGTSLAELNQKYSLATQDLGFINQTDLNPQLNQVLSKLRPGEVAPVQNPEGFQLIILAEKRSGKARPFEEVAPQVRQLLQRQAMEKQFIEWVKTLRKKAHIKIML